MTDSMAWSRAFARQARAYLATYALLRGDERVPPCHSLQFLQMTCEKLAKAHLCRNGSDPGRLVQSHVYIASAIPLVAREQYARLFRGRQLKERADFARRISHLAREIELLSPAARDGGRRPDNCEYPWELADGSLRSPVEHSFPNLVPLLREPAGIFLLRALPAAIDELLAGP